MSLTLVFTSTDTIDFAVIYGRRRHLDEYFYCYCTLLPVTDLFSLTVLLQIMEVALCLGSSFLSFSLFILAQS